MTIKAIKVFDWTQQRALAWIHENGQDRIAWIPMGLVYVNKFAVISNNMLSGATEK